MLERLSRERRNAALALLALLLGWFAWSVRDVLNPLLLAYLLAFMAHPAVLNLERRGWSRLGAVNMIYALFFAGSVILSLGLWAQGNQLVRRMEREDGGEKLSLFENFDRRFEGFIEKHKDKPPIKWLYDEEGPIEPEEAPSSSNPSGAGEEDEPAGEGAEATGDGEPADASVDVADQGPAGDSPAPEEGQADKSPSYFWAFVQRVWNEMGTGAEQPGSGQAALRGAGTIIRPLSHWFGSVMGFFTLLFLLPIYTWYLLFELERIHGFVRRYVPEREKERVSRIGSEIGEVIAGFFRGRLFVCLLKGLLIALGLWVANLPYALFLGLFAGFLSLIPFVGALFGFVFAFLVLLLDSTDVLGLALKTAAVFGIVEMIEGYVLVPKILGDTLGLHPLVVFVSVFVGGSALGMFGFLVALPLTAALIILCRELVLPALADFADEPDEDEEEPDSQAAEAESPEPA